MSTHFTILHCQVDMLKLLRVHIVDFTTHCTEATQHFNNKTSTAQAEAGFDLCKSKRDVVSRDYICNIIMIRLRLDNTDNCNISYNNKYLNTRGLINRLASHGGLDCVFGL